MNMKEFLMFAREVEGVISSLLPESPAKVAVACSGGGDSMALTLITHEWAKAHGAEIIAVTVDHGLREESGKEALQVGKWLANLGIAHCILKWEGNKPSSNLQENARKARYQLLTDFCKQHAVDNLLIAHTLDDQAETFLLRLRRGSGVDGLSAMSCRSAKNGVNIIRPLLGIRKNALLDYLKNRNQCYVSDPSNENLAYDRIKIRKFMPQLAGIGISAEKLANTAASMERARQYLRKAADDFITDNCTVFDDGYAILRNLPEPPEIALRVLARMLMGIGCHEVRPRLESLERLHLALNKPDFRGATVAGCKLQFAGGRAGILIMREPAAVAGPVLIAAGETIIWDRFEVSLKTSPCNLQVSALTQQGWLEIARREKLKNPYPDKKILYTLPALRSEDGTIACVPHLGIGMEMGCKAAQISVYYHLI